MDDSVGWPEKPRGWREHHSLGPGQTGLLIRMGTRPKASVLNLDITRVGNITR